MCAAGLAAMHAMHDRGETDARGETGAAAVRARPRTRTAAATARWLAAISARTSVLGAVARGTGAASVACGTGAAPVPAPAPALAPAPAPAPAPASPGLAPVAPVTAAGGKLPALLFAVVGDTRPATEDDTSAYPAGVIATLFADVEALRPRPPIVLSTGDYVFASTGAAGQAAPQLDIYLEARARYSGALFPAMGNHECTGATSSNCGPGSSSGITPNYAAFMQKMLAPLGLADPYYAVHVAADDGSWTAKFVFVAANAWSAAQEAWLDAALASPTTYTFVVRHEPASASTAPGVVPSEAVLARHTYTLLVVGHSHTYHHDASSPREVLIGNGGAPLTSKDYGFGLFARQPDGAIAVDMIDWR